MRCPACGHANLEGVDECASCMESLMQEDVPQAETPFEATIMDAPVASLSPPSPQCVPIGTSLREVVHRMQDAKVGYVLVTDADGRLAGIFTERDVLCRVVCQGMDLDGTLVETLMTRNPSTLHADEPIAQALYLMAIEPGYRYVPIVDEADRPTGLISFRRIARLLERAG
jgi:CBS domain-containing protein